MPHQYTVPLKKLIKDLNLQILYYPKTEEEILVSHAELMRPGLAFTGFFQGFVPARINMIGRTELAYLETLPPHLLRQSLEGFLSRSPKAVIITQDFSFRPLFLELAEKYCVPLMQSPENTTHMAAQLNAKLSLELAPRTTVHGVLMEIYGEGVLLTGDSGVGKSETALELLGVGIINVSRLFGVGSVKNTANINFVIQLETYDPEKVYDRIGLEEETTNILGMKVPAATIPVQTGRNLAVIIEVATMNYRQRAMGNNSAKELMEQLGLTDDVQP